MKLVIATLTAATLLAGTASAMVTATQIDPRDAALGATGQVTTGVVSEISVKNFLFDGRSKALAGSDTVQVTTFETRDRPADASDLR